VTARVSHDPAKARAAADLNAALELVLERVRELNGASSVDTREVQEFVVAAQSMATALGWIKS
jgi:hypothetical protein